MSKTKCALCGQRTYKAVKIYDKDTKKFLWHNVFSFDAWKMRPAHFLFFVFVLYMAWAYNHDLGEARIVYEDPTGFCSDWCEAQSPLSGLVVSDQPTINSTAWAWGATNSTG